MPPINPAPFRHFVRHHSGPVTISRRDGTTPTNYGEESTYTQLSTDRQMFIDTPDESELATAAGEFQAAMFVGYAVPSEDIIVNDRLQHSGITLEVTEKVGIPNDENPIVYRYTLDRP